MDENKTSLDKIDRKILYLLDVNGRMPHSKIAKKTNISKQRVKYRIERLESLNIIQGYFPIIDSSALGYTTFRVYFKFRNTTDKIVQKIINDLVSNDAIWAVVKISGKWDLALGISVKEIPLFYKVWEPILQKWITHIKDYAVHIYSPIYHYSKAYITGEKDTAPIRLLGSKSLVKHDESDLKILLELSKDARLPLIHIAENTNISAETVKYRLKKLESSGIIQGYRAKIDVSKLGYIFFKTEIRLASFDSIKNIFAYCHEHPNISQIDKTIGGETLEIEFHVHTLDEMHNIMETINNTFQNAIESWDYITVLSEEKTTYMPHVSESPK